MNSTKCIFILLLTLPLLTTAQLRKVQGYQFLDIEGGIIPQEDLGQYLTIAYGRYVKRNLNLKLSLHYEDFAYQWMDSTYYIYERPNEVDSLSGLQTTLSPRLRPGQYTSYFVAVSTEFTLLSQYEALYLGLTLQGRGGFERRETESGYELSYGAGIGPVAEDILVLTLCPPGTLSLRLPLSIRLSPSPESGGGDTL